MQLNQYRVFIEVVERHSFTAAARFLNYTQPGVSNIIAGMEKECGFPLFTRSKNGVRLTDQGEKVYELCQKILKAEDQLNTLISDYQGDVVGRIHIGSYYSIADSFLPLIIANLHRQFPKLEYSVHNFETGSDIALLRQGILDVGFSIEGKQLNCDFIPLFRDPSVAILPKGHPLAQKEVLSREDILEYELLRQENQYATELQMLFGNSFTELKSSCLFNYDPFMIRLVEEGYGIGVTSKLLVRPGYNVEVRPFVPSVYRVIGLVVPTWKPITAPVKYFIREACTSMQDAIYTGTSRKYMEI